MKIWQRWIKLRRFCLFLLILGGFFGFRASPCRGENTGFTVTDMAGREHAFTKSPERFFSVSPGGTILLYTLAPEMMCGWNYTLTDKEKYFILPRYHHLPVLGGWFGKSTGNAEEILKGHPEAIISLGHITPQKIAFADKVQAQLNLPVLMVDQSLEKMGEAYRFLGTLTGKTSRGEELGAYCDETVTYVQKLVQKISQEERPRVYYAEGPKGLRTNTGGSEHTESLEMAGGINVVQEEPSKIKGKGMKTVTPEQLYLWNPFLILCWSDSRGGYYSGIFKDPTWAPLEAVREKRIYEIPQEPFNWFDRPMSANRIIGLRWLVKLFYPSRADYSMEEEVVRFYSLFYHYDLSEEEVRTLLIHAL